MLEKIEQERFNTGVAKYKKQLNGTRVTVYIAAALLLVYYLRPLFMDIANNGEVMRGKLANSTYSQLFMLLVVVLATLVSRKKPFVMFLLLSLFVVFITLAIAMSVYTIRQYDGGNEQTAQMNWVIAGLFVTCFMLVRGTIAGYRYELLLKQKEH